MDELLLFLLSKGAHTDYISLTTTDAGVNLGMSQQNASRRLTTLEETGLIERKGGKIRLTATGIEELKSAYAIMKQAFEKHKNNDNVISLNGIIVAGLGEGAYYLSLGTYKKEIAEKIGFEPFIGTLNIKLPVSEMWKKEYIKRLDPIIINGFKEGNRTYGDILLYRCRIKGTEKEIGKEIKGEIRKEINGMEIEDHEGAILVPLRTHHGPEIIEVISPHNIKEKFGRKNGDAIIVLL